MSDEQDHFSAVVREAEIIRDRLLERDPGQRYSILTNRDLGLPEGAPVEERFARWRDYLAARYAALTERAAFRQRLSEPTLDADLERLVEGTRDDPVARTEVAHEHAQRRVDASRRGREAERQRLREQREQR
jgi:hypothetical protein